MKVLHYVDESNLAWGETWGQLLSEPLVVVGVGVLIYAVRMKKPQQGLPELTQNK